VSNERAREIEPKMHSAPRRRPTLKDVAAIAKVDPSLVSRVVNDDRRLPVSDATRKRVMAAIEQVGYRKNLAAQGLRTGRTGLLGYVVPDLGNPSYWQIIEGAKQRAAREGYTLLITTAPTEQSSATAFRELLDEGRVDGLLVASGILGDDSTAELLAGSGPVVVVNRRVPGATCAVVPDDEAASRLAASYLSGLGHRRCAILTGPPELETTIRRRKAFNGALKAAGLPRALAVSAPGWTAPDGFAAAEEVFASKRKVTAVYSTAGLVHVGLMTAAAARGIAIPEQLSVIALNDSPLNEFTAPPTTAIRMPLDRVGAAAVDLLLRRMKGETIRSTEVVTEPAPELVERNSTLQTFD